MIEKNLVAIKVNKQNIPKNMLFIKKTELILLFKIKKKKLLPVIEIMKS